MLENVVTVTATKPTATQPADAATAATDTATINITRGGTLHFSAITVPLNWSGTAVAGRGLRRAARVSVTFPPKVGVDHVDDHPARQPKPPKRGRDGHAQRDARRRLHGRRGDSQRQRGHRPRATPTAPA